MLGAVMDNSDSNEDSKIELKISFPESDQDHRLQLIGINGSIFAILYSGLESNGPISLDCDEWSLVLLAPIKSKGDIFIAGKNVICFGTIESEEGKVDVTALNQLVSFAPPVKSALGASETGGKGEYRIGDDTGVFLNFFQLFNKIIGNIRDKNHEEAQKRFLAGLCTLAAKIEENEEELTMERVLEIWGIELTASDSTD